MSYTYPTLSDCTTAVHNVDNIIKSAAPKTMDSVHQSRVNTTDFSNYTLNTSHSSFFANSLNSLQYTNATSPLSPNGHAIFNKSVDANCSADNTAVRPARYCHDPYNRSVNSTSLLITSDLSPEESFSQCYGGSAAESAPSSQESSPSVGKKSPTGQSKKRRQHDGPSARPQPNNCTVVPHTTKRVTSPVQTQRCRSSPTSEVEKTVGVTSLAVVMQQQQQQQQQAPVAEVSVRANVLSFFQSAALYTSSVEQSNSISNEGDVHQSGTRAVRTVVACGRVDRTSGRPVVRALSAQ